MSHKMPPALKIEGETAYAVYDEETGHIVHLHKVIIFAGATACSSPEAEARALELARRFGHSSQSLRVRAVAPGEIEQVMKSGVITD